MGQLRQVSVSSLVRFQFNTDTRVGHNSWIRIQLSGFMSYGYEAFLPFYAALNLFLESEMILISISSHFRDDCYKETENLFEDWNSLCLNEENVENNASY